MKKERLLSLDILRGFDLFMLVFLQPILLSFLGRFSDTPLVGAIIFQLDHEAWQGFRAWDLVMPLFLFMTGAAMPFSFSSHREESKTNFFLKKVVKRVVILWLLGMVIQGGLIGLNPDDFRYYSNTLQAIAMGYLITSIALLTMKVRGQLIFMGLLLLAYWIPMSLNGDFTPDGNLATAIDIAVLGSHRDDPSYTWIISSLNFGVTVMLGAMAGHIIRGKEDKRKIALRLLYVAIALIVGGLLLSLQMPIIKRIWSTSMTLFSGGLCFLLLTAFYYTIDCCGRKRGIMWLRYYGMNSIAAYMLGEYINFRPIVNQLIYGLEPFCVDYYPAVLTTGNFVLVMLILRTMFKYGKFIKI